MDDNPIIQAWEAANNCKTGPEIRRQFIAYLIRRYGKNLKAFVNVSKEDPQDA